MSKDWGPEGYCKHCNRMVATEYIQEDGSGLLIEHKTGLGRGGGFAPPEKVCPGSGRAPQKRVPKESRNHAFRFTPKRVKP